MFLPSIFNSKSAYLREIQTKELLESNRISRRFGLSLTPEEAMEIVDTRGHLLGYYGRIDLNLRVVWKLIEEFSPSSFIGKEDYAATINSLQDIFYYMKNETEDKIGDYDLIATIKNLYDNVCGGAMEFLFQAAESYCAKYRYETSKTEGLDREEE